MQVIERMFKIMDNKNIKANALTKRLNINSSTLSTWKARGKNPPVEYIPLICEVLEVSFEYLITGIETMPSQSLNSAQIENEFFKKYKTLTHDDKMKILGKLEMIAEEDKDNIKKASKGKSSISKTG